MSKFKMPSKYSYLVPIEAWSIYFTHSGNRVVLPKRLAWLEKKAAEDFKLLKKINAQILLLSIPYYRQHEKKFYCYRLYDPVSIKELLEHAMPNYTTHMFGQFHPVNRKDKLESGIIAFEDLNRDPDFIICRTAKC